MPNWVTNHLNVSAETPERLNEFIRFMEEGLGTGEEALFSFNRLVPMPESVSNTESGFYSNVGYKAWYGDPSSVLHYPWVTEAKVKDVAQLRVYLEKLNPNFKIQADLAKKAMDETGFMDWYQWSVSNWGVKWNAQSIERKLDSDCSVSFYFLTAWDFPKPIIEALASKFPDLSFDGNFFEESDAFEGEFDYAPGAGLSIEFSEFDLLTPPNQTTLSNDSEWF